MALSISTMQPGILVGLKTAIGGKNVSYDKEDLTVDADTVAQSPGAQFARWVTTRKVLDPEEYKRATKVRARARSLIASICFQSNAFGLLCPESKREQLEQQTARAREVIKEFNDSAQVTEIRLNLMCGQIASNEAEAFAAINSEVRDLMQAMEDAIARMDARAIRAAASRAREVGQMLTPQAKARVQEAIDAARAVATKIVKAGETAALEVDTQVIEAIAARRMTFLDLEPASEVAAPAAAEGRAVDFGPIDVTQVEREAAPVPQLDLAL